jgi:hypothetical protein
MKFTTVLMLVSIFAASTFYFFATMGEITLGLMLSGIMFCWPIGF